MTRLKLWRFDQGWTLDQAAERIGLSRSALHLIENGRLAPSAGQRLLLERWFGKDTGELLREVKSGMTCAR